MKQTNKLTGPTYLTIARMILSVLFMVFVLLPETWAKIVALILFVAGAISDLVDGKWARHDKIVTDLGAFLDPLADKMLVNLAFLALVVLGIIPV
jgi:CDP-diacylglycerol--glycerol-3-phosphate 3-phosphatidyltransferase